MRSKRFFSVATLFAFALTSGLFFAGAPPVVSAQEGGVPSQEVEPPEALVVTGFCKAPKVYFATNDAILLSTTSTSFVDVPGMSRGINIPGSACTCWKIQFCSFSFTDPNELMFVRALRDGAVVGLPGEVQYDGDSDEDGDGRWARHRCADFYYNNVCPGFHSVKIQFRSFSGQDVFIHKPTMAVHSK